MRVKVKDEGWGWEVVRGGGQEAEGDGLVEAIAGLGLGDGDGDGDADENEKKLVKEKVVTPDPLRQFGILVPRVLRTAQGEFEAAVQIMVRVLEVQREMERMEGVIEGHRRGMGKRD